jgi:hypothetical protein
VVRSPACSRIPTASSAAPHDRIRCGLTVVTVNVWLDRQVLPDAFVGLPGRTMQWVFDTAQLRRSRKGTGAAGHLSLVSSGAEAVLRQSNDELIALAWRELTDAVPEARAATLVRATVVREPQASFSLAPGQPARQAPDCRRRTVAGRRLGRHGLPATIESAVVSGHRAADDILSGRVQHDASRRGR